MKRLFPLFVLLFAAVSMPLMGHAGPAVAGSSAAPAHASSASAESGSRSGSKPDGSKPDKVELHPLKATDVESDSAVLVANLMTRYHYKAVPLDDAMSEKIYKAYLKNLDSRKMFFTQADIDTFSKWQDQLDDAIWNGDLSAPFFIFNRYRQAVAGRVKFARSLLKKGFDFSKKETYQLDRTDASWPTDKAALDKLWRKRVKNDWLRLKLADKNDDAIREVLDDRYAGYLHRISQVESENVFQTFLNAYANTTDPHTAYMGPMAAENFAIAMKLSLEGIGAVLEMRNDYTQVRKIVPGGPAAKSGEIHPGDRIVGVAQGKDGAMQNVIGWRLDDVVKKIRGEKNTVVRLEILPAEVGLDGAHQTVTLVRKKVSIKAQAAKKSVIKVDRDGTEYKVGVVDLPSFYQDFAAHAHGKRDFRSASRDVAKLLRELKKEHVDAIVMDLRNNGGGSLSEAVHMTGLFINKGPVVQVRDWRGKVSSEDDTTPGMLWSGPLAVLVNRGSASASEIFTAAMQDYGRALIIGSDTFGKGTVQNLVKLDNLAHDGKDDHGELKMTIAKFFRINGGSTQLRGVTPDLVYPSGIDKDEFGESSYPSALPWSSITPADYEPDANVKKLLPLLKKEHEKRIADDPDWQLQVAQVALAKEMRERTKVSLNLEERRAHREDYENKRKALKAKYGADENPAQASSSAPAKAASAASAPAAAASSAPAASASSPIPSAASSGIILQADDGLQPGERSLKSELADEKAAKSRKDVQLIETAHILADEVAALKAKPELVATVLPQKQAEPGTAD